VSDAQPGGGPADDHLDPLDELAQAYLRRHRAGEAISVADFAAAHPAHAAALLDLLPTLLALETCKRERETSSGGGRTLAMPTLERLGDFRIVRELGRGGMGVVFEAVQESLGRRVALKVLPQAALLTERQLQRFRREAHIAAQLHHSHIVPVFGSGESDGYHWYAMQYIAGASLDRWREDEAQRPPAGSGAWRNRARFVARLGAEAAAALHHAHQHGTLHRDIKPGNLLLDQDGQLWVTDFGLAKALEEEGLTHSGDLLGTLQYMAPEQFAGQYDPRSEVYALGVTLYELLALRPAYRAKTRSELLESIRTKAPTDLRTLCSDLPEDLILIVEKAIAREPQDRYGDAEHFARDLQAFLDDRPIAARKQTAVGHLLRWCRRNRAMAALAAATTVAVLAAAIYGWTMYGITAQALANEKAAVHRAEQESIQKEKNLRLTMSAFSGVFDAIVGQDPLLAFDEDPDTGEAVVLTPVVRPQNVAVLERILEFYDAFATQNEANQSLRLETARAYRRVAAIQGRFGKFDEAAKAYERSLERYQFVTERDVSREIAAVHSEFGQLEQRRGNMAAAGERFRRALQILDSPSLGASRAVRRERAEVHLQLARSFEFRGVGGGRPERGGAGGPGLGGPGAGLRAEYEAVQKHLQAARELAAELRTEAPDDPEIQALQARCLCFRGGGRGRGPEALRDLATRRDQQFDEGLAMFRQLVANHPETDAYRFELCHVLAGDPRRLTRGRWRPEDGAALARELASWQEAKGHADVLLARQPDFADYRALRARIGLGLAGLLRAQAANELGEAQVATQHTILAELRTANSLADDLVEAGTVQVDDPGFAAMRLAARLVAAQTLVDLGDMDAAKAEVRAGLAIVNTPSGVGDRSRLRWFDRASLDGVQRMLDRFADPQLQAEVDAVRAGLPPRSEGGRGEPGRGEPGRERPPGTRR
jgi:tetratricopeptide (TPR) repeat protein